LFLGENMTEKLQKVLAREGVASRREKELEDLIPHLPV